MQAVKLNKGETREEWLELRKNGIGGSDAAAIAGLNPWRSQLEVYLDKIGEIPETEDNENMYWGRQLEDLVAKEFAERSGKKVRRNNFILQHPVYPFMLANIDREIVGEEIGLECKTASEYAKEQWLDDAVPEQYILQCQHYMAVTGYQGWWIAVLIGGNKFIYKYIERDEVIINYLIGMETEFWHMVEDRIMPDPDGSESSTEILAMLYPESKPDTSIALPIEAQQLVLEYNSASIMEKEIGQQKEEIANKLKQMLGENEKGIIGDYTITWKTITSNKLDTKSLQKDHRDIYQKYSKQSSYRRFTIK